MKSRNRKITIFTGLLFISLFCFIDRAEALTINTETTWTPADSPMILNENITIGQNGKLTIRTVDNGTSADFVLKLGEGKRITFSGGGILDAQGTSEHQIFFASMNPDQYNWGRLEISSGANRTSTILKHCVFEHGGGDLQGTILKVTANYSNAIENCVIRESENKGVRLSAACSFVNCDIDNNTSHGIEVESGAHVSLTGCNIRENTDNGIMVDAAQITLNNCFIKENGSHGIYFKGNTDQDIDNCTIRDNAEAGIYYYNGGDFDGEITDSYIMDNMHAGIHIQASHCDIEIDNNTFSKNSGAVKCVFGEGGSGVVDPIISNNSFSENGAFPLQLPPWMHFDDTNTIDLSDNSTVAIKIYGMCCNNLERAQEHDDDTFRWYNFGIPYYIIDDHGGQISVGDPGGTPALDIEEGTEILFDPGEGITVGGHIYYGTLLAEGTKEEPIVFSSYSPGSKWKGILFQGSSAASSSKLQYCTIEHAGSDGSISGYGMKFYDGAYPSADLLQYTTVRYSGGSGIDIVTNNQNAEIHHCNIYANATYDMDSTPDMDATLNFWGSPNGPSEDLCSSAVVTESVTYDAWLAEPFTEPFRFSSAGTDVSDYLNPVADNATISFSLTASPEQVTGEVNWKVTILNSQLEQIWSQQGTGLSGEVTWNGVGDYGTANGLCFYKIQASSSLGTAAPAMGRFNVGDSTVALLTAPSGSTLYSPGALIEIKGIALGGGSYVLSYGEGAVPTGWTVLESGTANIDNATIKTWNTDGITDTVYTIKLDVTKDSNTYTDIKRINFYLPDEIPSDNETTGVRVTEYEYDALGRLKKASHPSRTGTSGTGRDSVEYTYDKVGNRTLVQREVPSLIELAAFSARPTLRGIVIEWRTGAEQDVAGFNLYRKMLREQRYERITDSLIPATGSPTRAASYTVTDVPPKPGRRWQYLLEEVENSGATAQYGPVTSPNISLRILTRDKNSSKSEPKAFRKSFSVRCD